jgi:hypothetical protein
MQLQEEIDLLYSKHSIHGGGVCDWHELALWLPRPALVVDMVDGSC